MFRFARFGLTVAAFLTLGSGAIAADKSTSHIRNAPVADSREGGETIADAIIFDSFNYYTDTGATCDNIDDYDEICPFSGSTSPDVVYGTYYNPCTLLIIDLHASAYDTKLFVYDAQMNLLACNDDYETGLTSQVDYIAEYSGMIYIVVDGYGGDCGAYTLNVDTVFIPPPYPVFCPAGAQIENEPELTDGYQDTFNGGCEIPGSGFQYLSQVSGTTELDFCGTLGWYQSGSTVQGDSDWFQVVAAGEQIIWTVDSQYSLTRCQSAVIAACDQPWSLLDEMSVGGGNIGTLTIPTEPGDVVTLWIEPGSDTRPLCFPYVFDDAFHLIGIDGVVATDRQSWGELKSLYR